MSLKEENSFSYKMIKTDSQIWMAENLDVTHFRNGDPIFEAKSKAEWELANKNEQPAWCYFENDSGNGKALGKLYNWHAVIDFRGLAPEGWSIPTDDDWKLLANFLGDDWQIKIKSPELAGNGTFTENEIFSLGINFLPGVYRHPDGEFNSLGNEAAWWSIFSQKYSEVFIDEDSGEEFSLERVNYVGHAFATDAFIDKSQDCAGHGMLVRCVMNSLGALLLKYGVHKSAKLTSITMEDVQSLAGQSCDIDLSGLTSLSDDVVQALSQNSDLALRLAGLTTLTDSAAKALGQYKGTILQLSGLTSLTDIAAMELSQFEGQTLCLDGLTNLTVIAAEALSRFKGGELSLNGITDLPATVAKKLSQFKGDELFLKGLYQLTDQTAQTLSDFKGNHLWLSGLSSLSDVSSQFLSACKKYIWFDESLILSDSGKKFLERQIKANFNRRLKENFLKGIAKNYLEFDESCEVEIYFNGSGDEFDSFNVVLVTDWKGQRLNGKWDLNEDDESLLFEIIDASGCNYNFNNYGTEGKIKYSEGKLSVETIIGYEDFGLVEWREGENG